MSEAELKRVIALLEESKRLARDKHIAELIERARRLALERVYPAARPFLSQRTPHNSAGAKSS